MKKHFLTLNLLLFTFILSAETIIEYHVTYYPSSEFVHSYPTNVIIGKDGTIKEYLEGYEVDIAEQLDKVIQKL